MIRPRHGICTDVDGRMEDDVGSCIPLAESMGGGGHAQACGFKTEVSRLPELLSGTFKAQPGN